MIIAVAERAHRAPLRWEAREAWDPCTSVALCTGTTRTRWARMGGGYVGRCVNLLPPSLESGAWDAAAATASARTVFAWAATEGHRLVLLGQRVSDAFGAVARQPGPHRWGREYRLFGGWVGVDRHVHCLVLPHPSGRGRVLDDPATHETMRLSIAAFARGAGETRFPYV